LPDWAGRSSRLTPEIPAVERRKNFKGNLTFQELGWGRRGSGYPCLVWSQRVSLKSVCATLQLHNLNLGKVGRRDLEGAGGRQGRHFWKQLWTFSRRSL
jgi:hypothetical protein